MTEVHELVALIEDLRTDLEAEAPVKLHQNSGEPVGEDDGKAARKTNRPAATGWTGLPFTPQFERYIGHSEQYGFQFIAAASIDEIAGYCRSHHDASHSEDGPASSTCKRLVVAVVEMRQPVRFVAAVEDMTIFDVRKFLLDVLRHGADWRGDKKSLATAIDTPAAPSLDPVGDLLRRQHQEASEEVLWNRLRLQHPYLSEWETEREHRAEQHRRLGCPACMTAAA